MNKLLFSLSVLAILGVSGCGAFYKKDATSEHEYLKAKEGQSIKTYAPNHELASQVGGAISIPAQHAPLEFDPDLVKPPSVAGNSPE